MVWYKRLKIQKDVIRSCKSKKHRQRKRTRGTNDEQSTRQYAKHWALHIPQNTRVNSGVPKGLAVICMYEIEQDHANK
jgi:hypothetical protein